MKNITVIGNHFIELRYRLFYLSITSSFAFLTCYFYSLEFLYLFLRPCSAHISSIYEKSFIFTEPAEAFYTTMKICFIISLFIMLPFILYQFWCFIAPSWYIYENLLYKNYIFFFCAASMIYVYLIHFYLLPEIFKFLLHFEVNTPLVNIELHAKIESYLDLALRVIQFGLFLIGIMFFNIYAISKSWITPQTLSQNRKMVFFFSSIFSALLAPPEVTAQLILLLVFIICFELITIYGYYHKYIIERNLYLSEKTIS